MSDPAFQQYTTGDNSSAAGSDTLWLAQTFTVDVAHRITSVDLKVFKNATGPWANLRLSIRNTAGDFPTGADLISALIDGATLPTGSPGALVEWFFTGGFDLAAGARYAIVLREDNFIFPGDFSWRVDTQNGLYTGGRFVRSQNSGSSWEVIPGWTDPDGMFIEYGIGAVPGGGTPGTQQRTLLL